MGERYGVHPDGYGRDRRGKRKALGRQRAHPTSIIGGLWLDPIMTV
jgi:hypothetical protein